MIDQNTGLHALVAVLGLLADGALGAAAWFAFRRTRGAAAVLMIAAALLVFLLDLGRLTLPVAHTWFGMDVETFVQASASLAAGVALGWMIYAVGVMWLVWSKVPKVTPPASPPAAPPN